MNKRSHKNFLDLKKINFKTKIFYFKCFIYEKNVQNILSREYTSLDVNLKTEN